MFRSSFPEIEKYTISQKGNSFLIGKIYRWNLTWWFVLTSNNLHGLPEPPFYLSDTLIHVIIDVKFRETTAFKLMATRTLSIVTCYIQLWGSLWTLDQTSGSNDIFDNVVRKISLPSLNVFWFGSKLIGVWSFTFLYDLFLQNKKHVRVNLTKSINIYIPSILSIIWQHLTGQVLYSN